MTQKNKDANISKACSLRGLPLFEFCGQTTSDIKDNTSSNCLVITFPRNTAVNKSSRNDTVLKATLDHAKTIEW